MLKNNFYSEIQKTDWTVVGPYINYYKSILVECPYKHKINITPHTFIKHKKCYICSGETIKQKITVAIIDKTRAEFTNLMEQIGWKILSPYICYNIKMDLMCNKCHLISMSPNQIKNAGKCPTCIERNEELDKIFITKFLAKHDWNLIEKIDDQYVIECLNKHRFNFTIVSLRKFAIICSKCKKERNEILNNINLNNDNNL